MFSSVVEMARAIGYSHMESYYSHIEFHMIYYSMTRDICIHMQTSASLVDIVEIKNTIT